MKRFGLFLVCALLSTAAARASDLNLTVHSYGSTTTTVGPGARVRYGIVGELSDGQSQGLAMFSLDLAFSGGPLAPATTPIVFPMKNFAPNLGLSNPQGYGGFVNAGALRQIGGAQNTINNTLAARPVGTVITGVAQPGQPATLVTGVAVAPYHVGTYTLTPSNLFANVIRLGATGTPFWKVDPAGLGTLQGLTITVKALRGNVPSVSVGAGGTQTLSVDAGPANAGRSYMILGSATGTSPGINVGNGQVLPLAYDAYCRYTRNNPNTAILQNSLGTLDVNGKATAVFHPDATFLGHTVYHAFVLLGPIDFVSEAEPVQVVP